MSLNTSHAQGGVLIYSVERILIYYDGVEMGFDMECHLPHFKGKKKGRAYLTTHRIIFNTKDKKDTLQSFSMPFVNMSEVDIEQPVFGANYLKGKIKAEQNESYTMSLNTSHAQGGVLIYSVERILIYYDGVEMGFDMECHLPHFKGKKKGRAYLTTHRIIFNTKDKKDTLQSFSMPFVNMSEVDIEQPVFGANYLKGKIKAEQNGNFTGAGKWKMWFNHGGAIDFGKALLKAGSMASRYARSYTAPQPPAYSPPAASAPYYQAPPPAYAPPGGDLYGFVPTQTFPTPPPYNSIYMTNAPPPYPGIDPNLTAYPPQGAPPAQYPPPQAPYPTGQAPYPQAQAPPPQHGYPQAPHGYPQAPPPQANGYPQAAPGFPQQNGFNPNDPSAAKAAEAAGSAYYAPSQPHNLYMPQSSAPPYPADQAPPAYNAAAKKND